ncbi:MAG: hypothetical protein LH603_12705, partial [Pseudonocardia sp.]|nr:hypothetical protein [Pseudonocardia sp.]
VRPCAGATVTSLARSRRVSNATGQSTGGGGRRRGPPPAPPARAAPGAGGGGPGARPPRPVDWPVALLTLRERASDVTVAPAHGLTLVGVDYPPDAELEARSIATRRRRVLEVR